MLTVPVGGVVSPPPPPVVVVVVGGTVVVVVVVVEEVVVVLVVVVVEEVVVVLVVVVVVVGGAQSCGAHALSIKGGKKVHWYPISHVIHPSSVLQSVSSIQSANEIVLRPGCNIIAMNTNRITILTFIPQPRLYRRFAHLFCS